MRSIRQKVTAVAVATFAVFLGVTAAVQYLVVLPAFDELERESAVRDARRCVDALARELELLSDNAHDWACWDDSYQYVQDKNSVFEQANLVNSLEATHVHFLCFLDNRGNVVWSGVESPDNRESLDLSAVVDRLRASGSLFRNHATWRDESKGIVLTPHGPMLLASRPVVDSARVAPIRGTILMGVFCDERMIADLAARTHVDLSVWRIPDDVPEEDRQALAGSGRDGPVGIRARTADVLDAYAVIDDAWGEPALLMRARTPRAITAQGRIAARSATLCGLGGGTLILIVLGYGLRKLIADPLRTVAAHAAAVGRSGNLHTRLDLDRGDEIGVVAREFDAMTAALAASQEKMLTAAHKAGMADVAADVLHNVGNALGSATCSVELLDEHLRSPKSRGIENAAKLLKSQAEAGRLAEFFSSDPRGPKLLTYLESLGEAVRREAEENLTEVERLRQTLRHICDVVAVQQAYAGKSKFRQEVDLTDLFDGILRMHEHELRAADIVVDRDYTTLPRVWVDKPKLVQVLVNLVRNAVQSLQRQSKERRLTVRLSRDEGEGAWIEVADTGIGIDAEAMPKLFHHGFTTKATGNGLGLHYCANAVREMGGDIVARSVGLGRGASFRVRLPNLPPTAAV